MTETPRHSLKCGTPIARTRSDPRQVRNLAEQLGFGFSAPARFVAIDAETPFTLALALVPRLGAMRGTVPTDA